MALVEIIEINTNEEWGEVRSLKLRYIKQEDMGLGRSRIDLFDDDRQTSVIISCPTAILPDPMFWVE